jgi:hypothetical protein
VYMKGLVSALDIFQGIKKSLGRWQMQEFPMKKYMDPNICHVESTEIRYQSVSKTKLPQWCPDGLTKTKKRRMQREC